MRLIMIVGCFLVAGLHMATGQEWLTDFEEAKKVASENDKPIVLVFAGSDWCVPCIKLEKQILHTSEFQKYAKEHYILMKADFPRKKKNQLPKTLQEQNNVLAEKYNRSGGFPLVVVLDKIGNKLGETGYKKVSPQSYIKLLNSIIQ